LDHLDFGSLHRIDYLNRSIFAFCCNRIIQKRIAKEKKRKKKNSRKLKNAMATTGGEQLQQGFLTKQGKVVMNWKRRWFQLIGDRLAYFKTKPSASTKKPLGYIPLRKSSVVKEGELPHKGRTPPCKDKSRHFSIHTPGDRTFYLFADSETEAREWVRRLNLLLPSGYPLHVDEPRPMPMIGGILSATSGKNVSLDVVVSKIDKMEEKYAKRYLRLEEASKDAEKREKAKV